MRLGGLIRGQGYVAYLTLVRARNDARNQSCTDSVIFNHLPLAMAVGASEHTLT